MYLDKELELTTTEKKQKNPGRPRKPEPTYEVTLPEGVQTEVNPFTGRHIPLLPIGHKPARTDITPAEIVARFHLAFEHIGGVSRFALWADANPTDFYKMYAKLLPSADIPQATQQAIQINLSGGALFPQSPLDAVELRAEKKADDVGGGDGD
jgi:hypothetical protein